MATRKPAAGEGESNYRMLKLTIENGPLSGQINEFRPGSRIQIGRVVRGNTLSIKDAGISSKHLIIQLNSASENWTVTDLGSSNGTFLNGVQLKPSKSVVLSDGDVIKIGEITSMRVAFELGGVAEEISGGNTRRNAKRRGRNQGGELGVIHEDSDLGLWCENEDNFGAGSRNRDLGKEGGKWGTGDAEKVKGRSTRRSKAIAVDNKSESVEGKEINLDVIEPVDNGEKYENEGGVEGKGGKNVSVIEPKVSVRRTRSSKNSEMEEKFDVSNIELVDNMENFENVSEIEPKTGRNARVRRTKGLNKDGALNITQGEELGKYAGEGWQRVSVRRTRSSRKEENLVALSVIEGKSKRKVGRGKTNAPRETNLEKETKDESNLEHEIFEEKTILTAADNDYVEEGVENGREDADGMANTLVKECPVGIGKGKLLKDLETMTLGEWFDFLEVFLPQQIIDATEGVISDMKQNAERVHEFKLQQMNAKEKGGVAID